jgi:hypothetical protein
MIADMPRYLFASIADAMKTVAGTLSLPVLVEHFDERTETFMQAADRAEIRITGPLVRHGGKDYYDLFIDVSVLLVSRYDKSNKNPFDIIRYAGAFVAALEAPIAVWNYGPVAGDYDEDDEETQLHLGCLTLRPGQGVTVLHHGQVDSVEKVKMSEINARLNMEFVDE